MKFTLTVLVLCLFNSVHFYGQGLSALTQRYEYVDDYEEDGFRVVANNGAYGMVNGMGVEVVPCIANDNVFVYGKYIMVKNDTGTGLYDTIGNKIFPSIYSQIFLPTEYSRGNINNVLLRIGTKNGVADTNGNILLPVIYDRLDQMDSRFIRVWDDNRQGVIAATGKVVLPLIYKEVRSYFLYNADPHAFFYVCDSNNKWGVVDTGRNILVSFIYDDIYDYCEDRIIAKKDGKWGVLTSDLRQLVPFKYDKLLPSFGVYKVKANDKWGVIDRAEQTLIPVEYDELRSFRRRFILAQKNNKWEIFDRLGKRAIDMIFDDYNFVGFYTYLKVSVNGQWGLLDSAMNMVVPCQYADAEVGDHQTLLVKQQKGWGVVDTTNKLLIPCKYEQIEKMCEGFYIGRSASGWKVISTHRGEVGQFDFRVTGNAHNGYTRPFALYDLAIANVQHLPPRYIDTNGKIFRLPSEKNAYQQMESFSEGLAAAKDDQGYWGYIDTAGNIVISAQYHDAGPFSGGLAAVAIAGKYGYINRLGQMVIEQKYTDARPFSGNTASVMLDYKWGLIDRQGKIVRKCIYGKPLVYSEGLMLNYVEKNDKDRWVLTDTNGHTIFSFRGELTASTVYSEGLAFISESLGKDGLIGRDGLPAMDSEFSTAYPFRGGRACVSVHLYGQYHGSRAGFIDKTGKRLGEFKYYELFPVLPGKLYAAKKLTGYGLVDQHGNELSDFLYKGIEPGSEADGLCAVLLNQKWGFVDSMGKLVIAPQYDAVRGFSEGLALVRKDSTFSYIDKSGKKVLNFKVADADRYRNLRQSRGVMEY